MPQLNESTTNISYQADNITNIHISETVNANSNKVINIPSIYAISKHPENISVLLKYKDEDDNIYRDASLFAYADINDNDTITVYNDSETSQTLYISIFG